MRGQRNKALNTIYRYFCDELLFQLCLEKTQT